MSWGRSSFHENEGWDLLFTVKDALSDSDEQAYIQKQSGLGITTKGSFALVSLLHVDTAENDAFSGQSILPGTYYWSIRASKTVDAVLTTRTVASGTLVLSQQATRGIAPELPIYTTDPPDTALSDFLDDFLDGFTVTRTTDQGPPNAPLVNAVLFGSEDPRVDGKTVYYAGEGDGGFYWTESGNLPVNGDVALYSIQSTSVQLFPSFGSPGYWVNLSPSSNPLEPWGDSPLEASGSVPGLVIMTDAGLLIPAAEFLGQKCRYGNASPYSWFEWDGSAWCVSVSSHDDSPNIFRVSHIVQCSAAYYAGLTPDPETLYIII